MRINDSVSIYARRAQAQATNPNFVYKTRNTNGLTGMEITGMTEADFKTVKIPDGIESRLKNLARTVFLDNFGTNDGEDFSSFMKEIAANTPEKERKNVIWTLDKIWTTEYQRIENLVSKSIPGWKTGEPFDRELVSDLISRDGIDQKD